MRSRREIPQDFLGHCGPKSDAYRIRVALQIGSQKRHGARELAAELIASFPAYPLGGRPSRTAPQAAEDSVYRAIFTKMPVLWWWVCAVERMKFTARRDVSAIW